MKKISLDNINLDEIEQLSREQLKNVLGGFMYNTTGNGGGGETTVPTKECGDWCGGDDGECDSAGSCPTCKEGTDPLDPTKTSKTCQ